VVVVVVVVVVPISDYSTLPSHLHGRFTVRYEDQRLPGASEDISRADIGLLGFDIEGLEAPAPCREVDSELTIPW